MQSKKNDTAVSTSDNWIPLSRSMVFLFSKWRLVLWSVVLFFLTALFTWIGFTFSIDFVDGFTGNFIQTAPDSSTIWGWVKHKGWLIIVWLYYFISRIVSFYLAFLLAYTLTSPGYVLLSTGAEKLYAGDEYEMDDGLSFGTVLRDIFEGVKIALFGIVVTGAALFSGFIPIIGQIVVFLLYTYYSALMFLDYPASRRGWTLGQKIGWLRKHYFSSFKLGLLPALVSMVPVVNIFLIALLFPILTVHTTLNFTRMEQVQKSLTQEETYGN